MIDTVSPEYVTHYDLNNRLRVFLYTYCGMINTLIHNIAENEPDKKTLDVCRLLFQSAGSSAETIFELAEKPDLKIKDAFLILRAVIETVVNTGLVMADKKYVDAAHSHALQKTARNSQRTKFIGSWSFSTARQGIDSFVNSSEVQEALIKFKERDSWINDKMPQKLEKLENHYGSTVSLAGSYYSIYAQSSEVLHGSYFGIMDFYGFNNRDHDIEKKFLDSQTEILFHTICCLNGLIDMYSRKYDFPKGQEITDVLFKAVRDKVKAFLDH